MQLTRRVRRGRTDGARRGRGEAGFTLVELLVSIVLMGIIIGSLGAALWTYFRTTNSTTNQVSESHDAQIVGTYWAQDVASVGLHDWNSAGFPLTQSVELNVGPTQGISPCGPASLPAATVRLSWDVPNESGPTSRITVAYVKETVNGQPQLHRIECDGNSTEVSDFVVVHNLDTISITCSTSCTGTGQNVPAVPSKITMTLGIKPAGVQGPDYSPTFIGQRRQT